MYIKQISIFIENKAGRLAAILDTLGKNNIDICALSIADTSDYGILRLIVNKPELAILVLKEIGVTSKVSNVIAVAIDDVPGGLSSVLNIITANGNGIDYMYAFVGRTEGKALVVFKVDDPERVIEVLSSNGIKIFDDKEIFNA